MMDTYQIRVSIEMVPSTEAPTSEAVQQADGSFQFTLSAADAVNIDACEQALLRTTYPSLRRALSEHLSAMSKKKPRRP
jgi:hypothetical protein